MLYISIDSEILKDFQRKKVTYCCTETFQRFSNILEEGKLVLSSLLLLYNCIHE